LFLICYSLARIAVEFVRVPDAQVGYFAGDWLTLGQLLSLPMLLGGIVLCVIAARQRALSGNYLGA
jgi:phosphatidylglycerol:prolipoprotein diacylglycerol transferase